MAFAILIVKSHYFAKLINHLKNVVGCFTALNVSIPMHFSSNHYNRRKIKKGLIYSNMIISYANYELFYLRLIIQNVYIAKNLHSNKVVVNLQLQPVFDFP